MLWPPWWRKGIIRMKELNKADFEAEVLGSDLPVVVEIWGDWWATCQILTAQVETLAKEEYRGKVNFYIVNAAANRVLIDSLNIRGVPSFLFYKNGQLYDMMSGNHLKKDHVRDKTDAMLSSWIWKNINLFGIRWSHRWKKYKDQYPSERSD